MSTGTSLPGRYAAKNTLKNDLGQMRRRSGELFLAEQDRRLSHGKDEELRKGKKV